MINYYKTKKYCCEDISLIENYDKAVADQTQTWICHHRAEILPCGNYHQKDLKAFNLMEGRPAAELVFLTRSQHTILHKTKKSLPKDTAFKMSNSQRKPRNKAFKHTCSLRSKGRVWMNDGKKDFFIKSDDPRMSTLKPGRLKGFDKEAREKMSLAGKGRKHSEKTKLKMSKCQTGLRFWTNGEITVRTYECPVGFVPGMAKAFKHK